MTNSAFDDFAALLAAGDANEPVADAPADDLTATLKLISTETRERRQDRV